MDKICIQCELTIVPGTGSSQSKFVMKTLGAVVFEGYESELPVGFREVAREITKKHAFELKVIAETWCK